MDIDVPIAVVVGLAVREHSQLTKDLEDAHLRRGVRVQRLVLRVRDRLPPGYCPGAPGSGSTFFK